MDSHNTLPIKKLLVAEDNESNFLLVMAILKKEYQIIRRWSGTPPKIPTILSRRHSHGSQNAKHGRIGSYP